MKLGLIVGDVVVSFCLFYLQVLLIHRPALGSHPFYSNCFVTCLLKLKKDFFLFVVCYESVNIDILKCQIW